MKKQKIKVENNNIIIKNNVYINKTIIMIQKKKKKQYKSKIKTILNSRNKKEII